VRIVNMRGVDLNAFDFDYDLTWAGFFMDPAGQVLGRYGGRDQHDAEAHLSLAGLKHAMRAALEAHRPDPPSDPPSSDSPPSDRPAQTAEQYPAASRLKKNDCIHCHQVYDFRREQLRDQGEWTRELIWVYPPPENLGLSLDPGQGDLVASVEAESPAARAGLEPGDRIVSLNGLRVASYADAQYALHQAPASGAVGIEWMRGDDPMQGRLDLAEGWRQSDISWRASMWGLSPRASTYGEDLSAKEKKQLGLAKTRLAFRQGNFVPKPAEKAGIRAGDIVLGIDGSELEMNMLQFNVHVRLNYEVGDQVTYNIVRDGKRLDLPMMLEDRDW